MKNKRSYQELLKENKALRIKNEMLSFFVDNSIDVIWEMDTSLKFTYVSSAVYENMGYTPEEWVGKRLSEFCTPRDYRKMTAEAIRSLKNYKTYHFTRFNAVMQHKEGHSCIFEIVGKVSFNKFGFPTGLMGSTRNITKQIADQKNLKDNEKRLQAINDSKDKLFSIIAHDLRAPFNSILGFSNLLDEDFERYKPTEQKQCIGLINTKLNETYKLVENLLLWSQSQKGSILFNPTPINLHTISEEIVTEFNLELKQKSIALYNYIENDFQLFGDVNIITTILRNLMSNAVKFSAKGKTISVSANKRIDDSNNTIVEISLKDDGIGIPEEIKEKLFEPGNVSARRGTNHEKGSGLGLSLCKELSELHNGDLSVKSKVGEGSTFTLKIPQDS